MEYRHQPRKFLRKFPQLYRLGQQNAPSFQVQSSKLRVDKGNRHSILVLVMLLRLMLEFTTLESGIDLE